jgi:hypothetical protein
MCAARLEKHNQKNTHHNKERPNQMVGQQAFTKKKVSQDCDENSFGPNQSHS